MNILLFLGSGVSYKTGLPDINKITDMVLNNKWYKDHSDQNYYSGENPNTAFEINDVAGKVQFFLKYLQAKFKIYYKNRNKKELNYEDLFYIIKQISDELNYESDNPLIEPYLKSIIDEFKFTPLFDHKYKNQIEIFKEYIDESIILLNCAIWHTINKNVSPTGYDLISEIVECKRFKKIDIATLNHDLLIEKYFIENKYELFDGFSKRDGDYYYFTPEDYHKLDHRVNLYKLHGSINWHRLRVFNKKIKINEDFYIKLVGNSHLNVCNEAYESVGPTLSYYPIFLTGTINKLSDYNFGIVRSVHLRFDEMLFKHNTIIMSGYGWNDKGINGRLMEWILSSNNRRIILLYENPESIKESRSAMWHRYAGLVDSGKLIIPKKKKWMSDTKLDDIIQYLK